MEFSIIGLESNLTQNLEGKSMSSSRKLSFAKQNKAHIMPLMTKIADVFLEFPKKVQNLLDELILTYFRDFLYLVRR